MNRQQRPKQEYDFIREAVYNIATDFGIQGRPNITKSVISDMIDYCFKNNLHSSQKGYQLKINKKIKDLIEQALKS